MTTKEKIIRKSIEQCKKRIQVIDSILDASPYTEIIKIRQEGQVLLNEYRTGDYKNNESFLKKIATLKSQEKQQRAIAKKQENTPQLIKEKVVLSLELDNLNHELYFIERRKSPS